MKNGKIKANKTKILARVMLVVLLFSSAINLSGCGKNVYVDIKKKFNLNDGKITFLCLSNISTNREVWGHGYCKGVYITDGNESYERPCITYSSTIVDEKLGDGRTFYEKHIKKYLSTGGSSEYSMIIGASFYAFQGDLGVLRYEFEPYYSKGEKIKIYNNDELIGIVSVTTKLNISKEFYIEMLDEKLFTITADKYLLTEPGDTAPKEEDAAIPPSLLISEISYLTIRDLRNCDENITLTDYISNFHGGYSSVKWQTGYEPVKNENKLCFQVPSLSASIQIQAEFYEYREKMGKIEYEFVSDLENGDYVELYSHSILVGRVLYSSDVKISEEWMVRFLNENLVVISVKK